MGAFGYGYNQRKSMFFRREKPKTPTFAERIQNIRKAGFDVQVQPSGLTRVLRGGYAADLKGHDAKPEFVTTGIVMGPEIGRLTDLGYQKIFETPSGRRQPAQAEQLKTLHAFTEDLVETLGLTSLYNEALGTINQAHVYDRVEGRDRGVSRRPWQS
jgi:hypothetical protein